MEFVNKKLSTVKVQVLIYLLDVFKVTIYGNYEAQKIKIFTLHLETLVCEERFPMNEKCCLPHSRKAFSFKVQRCEKLYAALASVS